MHGQDEDAERLSRYLYELGIKRDVIPENPYPGRGTPLTNGAIAGEGVLEARAAYRAERLRQAKERTASEKAVGDASATSPTPTANHAMPPPAPKSAAAVTPPAISNGHETNSQVDRPSTAAKAGLKGKFEEPDTAAEPQRPLYEIQFFMERPFFAIPHKGPIELQPYSKDGFFIKAKALDEALGVATIDDAEILMVIGTELLTAVLEDPNYREVTLKPAHTLRWIRRGTGKNQYDAFYTALRKLCTTEITTNIGPDGQKGETVTFSFLESWEAPTLRHIKVKVSDWVAAAIINKKAIRIPKNYFDLSRGFERWLCRVACKHVGSQKKSFHINLDTLYKKSGSNDDFASFRYKIKQIVKAGRLLDHVLTLVEDRQLKISPRSVEPYVPAEKPKRTPKPLIKPMR